MRERRVESLSMPSFVYNAPGHGDKLDFVQTLAGPNNLKKGLMDGGVGFYVIFTEIHCKPMKHALLLSR